MALTEVPCLIGQAACGRVAGNPVCPKCGMDERVVYPGQVDREAAQAFDQQVVGERCLAALELGSAGSFAGFLAAARNGRGLVFHVTALEPETD